MKKPLLIFGCSDIAQIAHLYFSMDTEYEVVAFTVDNEFRTKSTFCDLPLMAFETIIDQFSPKDYEMFIALSYSKLNQIRKDKFFAAKKMGYKLASYISPRATVLNEGNIGDNCFIFEDNTIQPFVTIGNNVTLWSGNHIGHHTKIHDHCFLASHIVVSGGCEIEESCFIGVNATLRDHIRIGEKCIIGAGTLILNDTEPKGVYKGTATVRSEIESTKLIKI
jgi:sugar O-acyltransferase (sialic acid O-acetyltransferase NeuD family)